MHSNLNLNGFMLPIAAMNIIGILPLLILAPLLEFFSTYYQYLKKSPPSPVKFISMNLQCNVNQQNCKDFIVMQVNLHVVFSSSNRACVCSSVCINCRNFRDSQKELSSDGSDPLRISTPGVLDALLSSCTSVRLTGHGWGLCHTSM